MFKQLSKFYVAILLLLKFMSRYYFSTATVHCTKPPGRATAVRCAYWLPPAPNWRPSMLVASPPSICAVRTVTTNAVVNCCWPVATPTSRTTTGTPPSTRPPATVTRASRVSLFRRSVASANRTKTGTPPCTSRPPWGDGSWRGYCWRRAATRACATSRWRRRGTSRCARSCERYSGFWTSAWRRRRDVWRRRRRGARAECGSMPNWAQVKFEIETNRICVLLLSGRRDKNV